MLLKTLDLGEVGMEVHTYRGGAERLVALVLGGEAVAVLTVADARDLADVLSDAVRMAEGEQL